MSSYVCDLQQQQQPLAVMQISFLKANLVTSSLLFITSASPLHKFQRFQQQSLPPACVSTVPPHHHHQLPGGHKAGHTEVKVPISPELGPLSHLFLQNCGTSAGQRRTDRLVGRSVILFQNLKLFLDSLTKRSLNADLVSAALLDRSERSRVRRLSGV